MPCIKEYLDSWQAMVLMDNSNAGAIMRYWVAGVSLGLICLLQACSSLVPGYERPQVNLTSFALAPDSPGGPRFNIGLQVINPNRTAIRLAGMSFTLEVEGNRILTGVQNNLPVVAGFGTADILVQASPDLLGGARLISDLLHGPGDGLDYRFRATLDAGRLLPAITLEESGSFNLNRAAQAR